jgi:hypothetical protein
MLHNNCHVMGPYYACFKYSRGIGGMFRNSHHVTCPCYACFEHSRGIGVCYIIIVML